MTATKWHVFCVQPRREDAVCDTLTKRGIEARVPHTRAFERVSRKKRVFFTAPVFAGYVFAAPRDWQWPQLRTVRDMSATPLMSDGAPHCLSAADLDYLEMLARNPPRHWDDPRRIVAGDRVRIAAGPLQGLPASVSEVIGKHITVLANLLGRMTSVRLAPEALELV